MVDLGFFGSNSLNWRSHNGQEIQPYLDEYGFVSKLEPLWSKLGPYKNSDAGFLLFQSPHSVVNLCAGVVVGSGCLELMFSSEKEKKEIIDALDFDTV